MGEGGTAGGGGSGGGTAGGGGGSGGGGSSGKISRITKGDKGRTLMHASVANEVIDAVNEHDGIVKAIRNAKVSPETAGSFMWSDANMVLKLSGALASIGNETVTGAVNGVPATLVVKTDGKPWAAI